MTAAKIKHNNSNVLDRYIKERDHTPIVQVKKDPDKEKKKKLDSATH